MKKLLSIVAIFILALALAGCSGGGGTTADNAGNGSAQKTEAHNQQGEDSQKTAESEKQSEKESEKQSEKQDGENQAVNTEEKANNNSSQKITAVMELEKGGKVVMELYPVDAPQTVANFEKLANSKFYDGLTFHRVIAGFMAQGGDPDGSGRGGPGWTIPDEFNSRKHLRGTVAMARPNMPDSAGSQFYICFAPQPHLDNQYTVFGQVTEGMEFVDQIQMGDRMKTIRVTKE